jgi:polyisoprenoid-binding protein YceI
VIKDQKLGQRRYRCQLNEREEPAVSNWIKWGAATVVVIGAIGIGWFFIRSGSGEASAPITAPPVTEAATTTVAPSEESTEPAESGSTGTFAIVAGESEARFVLQEDLNGSRIDVIGRTTQVAGEILADPGDLSSAAVGTVVINVRTLETGNSFRDRAIRGNILDSAQDEFEFATFVPTSVEGIPDSVEIGQPASFTIVGDLTVKGVTSPVTFAVEASFSDAATMTGTATAQVTQAQFDINIRAPSQVANISEEIDLVIDFIARTS